MSSPTNAVIYFWSTLISASKFAFHLLKVLMSMAICDLLTIAFPGKAQIIININCLSFSVEWIRLHPNIRYEIFC
jgi:hypothetical protein